MGSKTYVFQVGRKSKRYGFQGSSALMNFDIFEEPPGTGRYLNIRAGLTLGLSELYFEISERKKVPFSATQSYHLLF